MNTASILWRLCLSAILFLVAWSVYDLRQNLPAWMERQIAREAAATRLSASLAIADTRRDLMREMDVTRRDLLRQSTTFYKEASRQLTGLRSDAALQLSGLRQSLDHAVSVADTRILEIHADLRPTLSNLASITRHADDASSILFRRDALPAQTLGLLAASKVTMGETARTMRTIRSATPVITANITRATDESALAASQTRITMKNLADATRPLPRWLRLPLSVTGALAPTAAGALGAAAATGAFR